MRGKSFDWDEASAGRSPHLDQLNATSLMRDVLALYKRQNENRLPSRVVLHKSSRFTDEEGVSGGFCAIITCRNDRLQPPRLVRGLANRVKCGPGAPGGKALF